MRDLLLRLVAIIVLWLPLAAQAQTPVRVGGYDFPPYVESAKDGGADMVSAIIAALNTLQSDYRFEFMPVSARRRYADLMDGRFDVMFFESPHWGWRDVAAAGFTKVFMTGAEIYVAQAQPGRGQAYFDDLAGKSLVGILGYHYGFAGFEADPKLLERKFDIKLVNGHRSSIELVLAGRRDMAVVTEAYLRRYIKANPHAQPRLLLSQRQDQVYEHRAVVRQGGPITVATLERLLDKLEAQGLFKALNE